MSHCIHIIADESLASRTAEMLEAQCGISTTLSYLCQCPTGVLDSVVNMPRSKVKVIPQQAEVAQGVPGSLRPRIFLMFGTTRVVGRQQYAPAAFTHLQRLSPPQGTSFCQGEPRKKFPVTPPGIDPGTVRLVAQCRNHYATLGPICHEVIRDFIRDYLLFYDMGLASNIFLST